MFFINTLNRYKFLINNIDRVSSLRQSGDEIDRIDMSFLFRELYIKFGYTFLNNFFITELQIFEV